MSAPTYRWDDPFRTGFAGTYDPGTMYGLILRSQQGDAAAKNHLAQAGFYGQYGQDVWGNPEATRNGDYGQAVQQWAQSKGLNTFSGPAFQWNQAWTSGGPGFQQAWDSFYNQKAATPAQTPAAAQQPAAGQAAAPRANVPQAASGGPYAYGGAGVDANGFRTQAGGVIPRTYMGQNVFTPITTRRGTRIELPSMYNPAQGRYSGQLAALGTAQGNEDVMGRIQRRLSDIEQNGTPLTPDIIQNEMRRTIQEAMAGTPGMRPEDSGFLQAGQLMATPAGTAAAPAASPPPGGGSVNPPAPPAAGTPATGTGGSGGPGAQTPPVTPPAGQTPPSGYLGGNAGDVNGLSAANRMGLATDPQQAYRYMMQQLGMNPDQVTGFSKFMKQRFAPLLEARVAAAGASDNSGYMDNVDQIIRDFGSGLTQQSPQGTGFFNNLQQIGNQAAQSPFLSGLNDQDQVQQYLAQIGQLRFAGANPMVQQSMADQMKNAFNQYNDADFYGNGKVDAFKEWLLRQSQYRGIFGY